MKKGDLVRLKENEEPRFGRNVGTVLGFDWYRGLNHKSDFGTERIIEILWDTGELGWILADRVEVIND